MRRWQLLSPRRLLPAFLAGVVGFFVLLDLFVSEQVIGPGLGTIAGELLRWTVVLTAFALVVGVVHVIRQHLSRTLRRDEGWPYSLALLAGLVLVLGVTLAGQALRPGQDPLNDPLVQGLFEYVYTPLSASLLALLAFFGLSAGMRAFSSGRRDAVVLVVVTIIMLLLQIPAAARVPTIGLVARWIQDYLALAGIRGLILGGALGALLAGVRVLMGVDRPYLDR